MKILVSGSKGLIGKTLCAFLTSRGHDVWRLARKKPLSSREVFWNPAANELEEKDIEGFEAIIHLAGENIASSRWTNTKKAKIRDSRVLGTRLLSGKIAKLQKPPKVMICSSAIGFYGDRGEEILDEKSAPGSGFLPEVCKEWEEATVPAKLKGLRVVNFRTSLVLASSGGALAKMLPPFRLGLGGRLGTGRQWMSWIALDDILGALLHCLEDASIHGAVNATSPNAVRNAEFTKTLGKVLHRPAIFPVPAFALKLLLGEMADALLLSSTCVSPRKLMDTSYAFRYPLLEDALQNILKK